MNNKEFEFSTCRYTFGDKVYIGDICYCMDKHLYDKMWGPNYSDGLIFPTIYDKRDNRNAIAAVVGTKYGDGEYSSNRGPTFYVDAGVIGVVGSNAWDSSFNPSDYGGYDIVDIPEGVNNIACSIAYEDGDIIISVCDGNDKHHVIYSVCIYTSEDEDNEDEELDESTKVVKNRITEADDIENDIEIEDDISDDNIDAEEEFFDTEVDSVEEGISDINEELNESGEYTLADIANEWYAFGNDCRLMHLYTSGIEFKMYHETLNELYDVCFDAYDHFAEMAIAHGETIINPSLIEYDALEGDHFTAEEIIEAAVNRGDALLDKIKNMKQYESYIQSNIDEHAGALDKLINYIFVQSGK